MRTLAVVFIASLVAACANTGMSPDSQPLPIAPSPITYDGNVAGQATNLIFVLERKGDPSAPGHALAAGDTLAIRLPKDFKRNDVSKFEEDSVRNLILTRGWPQAAVPQKGQYRIFYDPATNTIGVRAVADVRPEGRNAPGIKIMHLRGQTFLNPSAGAYPIEVTQRGANGATKAAWSGKAMILADAPAARLAPTNFHLPPGTNSNFQKMGVSQSAPHLLGLLLWGDLGVAMNGVGIASRDLARYPKYTGGLLVQDTNGDGRLDASVDRVVGGIVGAAPQGARGQSAASPQGSDGRPILSGQVMRNAKFPGGGNRNPGLLPVAFKAGDKPGLYRPAFELIGGNAFQFTLIAQ